MCLCFVVDNSSKWAMPMESMRACVCVCLFADWMRIASCLQDRYWVGAYKFRVFRPRKKQNIPNESLFCCDDSFYFPVFAQSDLEWDDEKEKNRRLFNSVDFLIVESHMPHTENTDTWARWRSVCEKATPNSPGNLRKETQTNKQRMYALNELKVDMFLEFISMLELINYPKNFIYYISWLSLARPSVVGVSHLPVRFFPPLACLFRPKQYIYCKISNS